VLFAACNEGGRTTDKRVGIINDLESVKAIIEIAVADGLYTNASAFVTELTPNIVTNSGFKMLGREIDQLWINSGLSNWIASGSLKPNTNLAFVAKYSKGKDVFLIGLNFHGNVIEDERLKNQVHDLDEIFNKAAPGPRN
jgi:hypothetical protein